jgi:hypothetical protein
MKKKILLKLFFCLIINQLNAQIRLGASFGYALPTGDFGTINKSGFGGSIGTKHQLSPRFALTNSFGFYAFGRSGGDIGDFVKKLGLSDGTAQLISLINSVSAEKIEVPKVNFFPINLGFEYYILTDKIRPYLGLDMGMYVNDTEDINLNFGRVITQYYQSIGQAIPSSLLALLPTLNNSNFPLNGNDTNFGLAPTVGCNYQLSERWLVDFNIKANALYASRQKQSALVLSFNLGVFFQLPKAN